MSSVNKPGDPDYRADEDDGGSIGAIGGGPMEEIVVTGQPNVREDPLFNPWGMQGNWDTSYLGPGVEPGSRGSIDVAPGFTYEQIQEGIEHGKSTLWGKIQWQIEELKDHFKSPQALFDYVLKSVVGISKDDKGNTHFQPTNLLATIAGGLTGGAASIAISVASKLADKLGITPDINISGNSPVTGTADTHFKPGEFIPENPYIRGPHGELIPDTRNYTVVPQISADGSISDIIVGSNDGNSILVIAPDDFSRYGLRPDNIYTYDYSTILNDGHNYGGSGIETSENPPIGGGPTSPIPTIVVTGPKNTGPDAPVFDGTMTDGSGQNVNLGGGEGGIPIVEGGTPPQITVAPKKQTGPGIDDTDFGNHDNVMQEGSGQGVVGTGEDGIPIIGGGTPPTITVGPKKRTGPDDTDPHIPDWVSPELPPVIPGPIVVPDPTPKPTPTPTPDPFPDRIPEPPNPDGGVVPKPTPTPTPSSTPAKLPDFQYFAMPEFKILPNNFGSGMTEIKHNASPNPTPDDTFRPQDHVQKAV